MAPEERTAERLERLQSQVQAHENELLRVLRELPDSEGQPRELFVPSSLPLPAIRAALPADTMIVEYFRVGQFFFSSRRRHTRSVSAFLLNRSSDLQSEPNRQKI